MSAMVAKSVSGFRQWFGKLNENETADSRRPRVLIEHGMRRSYQLPPKKSKTISHRLQRRDLEHSLDQSD